MADFAIQILKVLEKLPLSSGTRFCQPILILATAGELQFPTAKLEYAEGPGTYPRNISTNLDENQIDIAWARRFVMSRLQELQVILPKNPVERIQMVIKETWNVLDAGVGEDVWLDVMMRNQWETIAG